MIEAVAGLLDRLGVPAAAPLLVHAGFRGLGQAGWRAGEFLDQLLARQATVLMPAMSWRAVNPAAPEFDAATTPGITGILGELFRTTRASQRSLHPTHSTCGCGPGATALLDGHALDLTPCSRNSPFGRLIAADGWVLLIGVGLERCTTIHCAEETLWPELYLLPAVEEYRCRALDGTVRTVRTRRHVKRPRDFDKFASPMAGRRFRVEGLSGVPVTALAAADLDAVVRAALAEDPEATFA